MDEKLLDSTERDLIEGFTSANSVDDSDLTHIANQINIKLAANLFGFQIATVVFRILFFVCLVFATLWNLSSAVLVPLALLTFVWATLVAYRLQNLRFSQDIIIALSSHSGRQKWLDSFIFHLRDRDARFSNVFGVLMALEPLLWLAISAYTILNVSTPEMIQTGFSGGSGNF